MLLLERKLLIVNYRMFHVGKDLKILKNKLKQ